MWLLAHLFSLAYGLAAALVSISAFYLIGLLMLPRRWQSSVTWTDCIILSLGVYVLLCWIATSARHIPVMYMAVLVGLVLWGLIVARFRSLQSTLSALHTKTGIQQWLAGFSMLYGFAYLLIHPPAGAAVLTLPATGALDLVTYARYARELLSSGTASVDFATLDYLRTPASAFLLAWHSLFFFGDPLDAAMPLIFMIAAVFGAFVVELTRSLFGLSWRAAMTVAAIAMCAPLFRWILETYSLGSLLSATCVLYLVGMVGRVAVTRPLHPSLLLSTVANIALLFLSAGITGGAPGGIARGVVEVIHQFSPLALVGLPGGIPRAVQARDALQFAALLVLPLVPLLWAAALSLLRRSPALGRIASPVDRKLAGALVIYVAVGVIAGNVAVQAVRAPAPRYVPGLWRQLNQIGRMPFRAVTLKVTDEPNGLSTALALYYMPRRQANVIGRGVSYDDLPFESVSRQQPLFIQNFGCEGVGHGDTVSAPGVGCLLLAPPSMVLETTYPFNRTFLFMDFDRMTSRESGGRWNTGPVLNLRFTVDPQRVRLDRDMYVNFLVNTFRSPADPPLPLRSRWGQGRHGEFTVGERQWFSLPVASSDWSGNRLWTLPVAIDFPEGKTILFHEVALTESPRGQVARIVQNER